MISELENEILQQIELNNSTEENAQNIMNELNGTGQQKPICEDKKLTSLHIVINNPDKIGITTLKDLEKILKGLKPDYACASYETGKHGTKHIHIYMRKKNRWRFSQIQTAFNRQAHIEDAIKGDNANYWYITKDLSPEEIEKKQKFLEIGEPFIPAPGKRNDIVEIKEMVEKGMSAWDIVKAMPSHALKVKEIENLIFLHNSANNVKREITTIYIQTNDFYSLTNKLKQHYGYNECFVVDFEKKFPYDSYSNQHVFVIKEPFLHMSSSTLISMIDGAPYSLDARFHDRPALYNKVFILSRFPLAVSDQHCNLDELAALRNLIKEEWSYDNGIFTHILE